MFLDLKEESIDRINSKLDYLLSGLFVEAVDEEGIHFVDQNGEGGYDMEPSSSLFLIDEVIVIRNSEYVKNPSLYGKITLVSLYQPPYSESLELIIETVGMQIKITVLSSIKGLVLNKASY